LDPETSIADVRDAHVVITDLETEQEVILNYSEELGSYTAEAFPKEDGYYRIDVDHPDYPSVYAYNEVPRKITIGSLDTSTVFFDGEKRLQVNFNIIDDEEADNYYVWDLLISNESNENILPSGDADLVSTDNNTEVISDESFNAQSMLFIQDDSFNGTEYATSFLTEANLNEGLEAENSNNEEELKIQLRIMAVSEDLFEYLKSVESYYQNDKVNSSTINPIEIRSNIHNGLGIFGAFEQSLIEVN
jgi:hypothetical protein